MRLGSLVRHSKHLSIPKNEKYQKQLINALPNVQDFRETSSAALFPPHTNLSNISPEETQGSGCQVATMM